MVGENTSERAMKHEVLRWLDELRSGVEQCVQPYLAGYFMRRSDGKTSRLPAIEVYGLRGAPTDKEAFVTWLRAVRRWWDSLGFGFDFTSHLSNGLMFVQPADDSPLGRSTCRLVVRWEPYLTSVRTDMYGGDERNAVFYNTSRQLDGILTGFVVIHFLETLRERLETLRHRAFRSVRKNWLLIIRMGSLIKLHRAILSESMLLDRITMEFEHRKERIEHETKRAVGCLEIIDSEAVNENGNTLSTYLLDYVDSGAKLLKKHLAFVARSFSDYLTLRNTEVMYWLTIVVTFATLLGLAAAWPSIRDTISTLWRALTNV